MIRLKTKEEIALLREGGARHSAILRELKAMVKPDLAIIDLYRQAVELIKKGGDSGAFLNYKSSDSRKKYPASLCVSINDEVVHGVPTQGNKVLKEGDIVTLDLGLVHKGMFTDMAITVPVGKISLDAQRLITATENALKAGIRAAKGGNRLGDIGAAIEMSAHSAHVAIIHELC